MKNRWYGIMNSLLAAVVIILLPTSCSVIDDDLSDCGSDYQLDYELQLVTNMTTELSTQLTTMTDLKLAAALRTHLTNIFTDFAHDVDLSFYDVGGDSVLLQHDSHIMDDNQASYTLYLPKRRYMHLAVANVVNNPVVSIAEEKLCHKAILKQPTTDTISSHTTGVFTAREQMQVLEGVDQTFNVHLYMANCATTLVVDTVGSDVRDVKVFTTGFASSFCIADSAYQFADKAPIVRTQKVDTGTDELTFCSVNFPSKDILPSRSVIETIDPFVSATAENSLWEFRVYVTLKDGSVTETILYLNTPLRAGQLRLLKCWISKNGGANPKDQTVGVQVTTQWNSGGQYEPEL